jgi:hypothetical protein
VIRRGAVGAFLSGGLADGRPPAIVVIDSEATSARITIKGALRFGTPGRALLAALVRFPSGRDPTGNARACRPESAADTRGLLCTGDWARGTLTGLHDELRLNRRGRFAPTRDAGPHVPAVRARLERARSALEAPARGNQQLRLRRVGTENQRWTPEQLDVITGCAGMRRPRKAPYAGGNGAGRPCSAVRPAPYAVRRPAGFEPRALGKAWLVSRSLDLESKRRRQRDRQGNPGSDRQMRPAAPLPARRRRDRWAIGVRRRPRGGCRRSRCRRSGEHRGTFREPLARPGREGRVDENELWA